MEVKPRKSNARRCKKVSIDVLQNQLRTVLARDIGRLMEASYTRALERDEAVSLRQYIELINELKELDRIAALENQEKEKK